MATSFNLEIISARAEAAQELVRNLDGIVWAVNPKNDSVESLTLYLCEYTQRFLSATSIASHWDLPPQLPSVKIASEIRHNLFLVFKEALNNAVKHAECAQIRLQLHLNDSALSLSIQDDGRGFSMDTGISSSGNGLQNMEARMKRIGGCFELKSEAGKGTRISLRIPTAEL